MLNPQLEKEFIERRIRVVLWIMILCFVVFFIGFWYLQVIRGPYYQVLARENILKEFPLPAPRGLIIGTNNEIVAENRLSHNLFITPGLSKNLENTLEFLEKVTASSVHDLKNTIVKEGSLQSLRPVLVYQDLSLPQVAFISARKIEYPELEINQETKRSYKYDSLFAHVLGYVGELTEEQERQNTFPEAKKRDIVGQAGLERYYNRRLMGEDGYEIKIVNSNGMELKEKAFQLPPKPAIPGNVLRVALDYNMQKAAHDAFREKERYGSAVALNIKTGEVMVMYSNPYFNPNDFIPKIPQNKWKELLTDPRHPLQNRVIQNKFSPGSTFKVVMALAALQEKKIRPDTTFFCPGSQFIYNRTFRCWKPGGHGTVNLHQAIVHSCDVYFYNVGLRLDIDVIARYAKLLGLGSSTNIDLLNESPGLVPNREWKQKTTGEKWYPGETISVAIGQGPILATALQMASLYATVAADGFRVRPHLLSALLGPTGKLIENKEPQTEKIHGIDQKNFEFVKRALWGVVNEGGTGGKAKVPGYDVCGKTGTVQVVGFERGGNLWKHQKEQFGDHAWFISFAPLEDPQVAIAVFVEHGGHGSDAAAPVAQKIFETYFRDRKIGPYNAAEFAKSNHILARAVAPAANEQVPQ
jgi:penicillin-binding protein 2